MATLQEFISKHKTTILERTQRILMARDPRHGAPEVLTMLESFLDELVTSLSETEYEPPWSRRHPTPRQPLRRGIESDVTMTFAGYRALGDAIASLAAEHGIGLSAREFQGMSRCFGSAVASSVAESWDRTREAAERESSRRAGVLAHELRNALATATTAFTVLHEGETDNPTAAILERSLERMSALVEHTLIELRLRSSVPMIRRRLAVGELLHEIHAAAVLKREVRLRVVADDALEIEADPSLVMSAVTNLVHNALKFTRSGGLVVMRATALGSRVVVEVEDECGGLPPTHAKTIFSSGPRTTRSPTGNGLGLAIAREAAEKSGGTLTVRDMPGRGCIFALEFPRAAELPPVQVAAGS